MIHRTNIVLKPGTCDTTGRAENSSGNLTAQGASGISLLHPANTSNAENMKADIFRAVIGR